MVSLFVEISHGWQAEVGEIVTKFLKVLLAQHLRFSLIGTPSHAGGFYYFRLVFAICHNLNVREPPLVELKAESQADFIQ